MVAGSGRRFSLSQAGEGCTVAHCITANLPGPTTPQNESESDEELGGLGLRDVIVRTQSQLGSRTDKAHEQGSQRLSRSAWGPWGEKACSPESSPTHTFTMPAVRLHRSGCYRARSVVSSLRRVASVERPVLLESARFVGQRLFRGGIGLGSRGRMIVGKLPTGLKIVLPRSVYRGARPQASPGGGSGMEYRSEFCVARRGGGAKVAREACALEERGQGCV